LRIQWTRRRALARRKKTTRARLRHRPSAPICSGLNRHALSGPSRRSGRSNRGAFCALRSDCTSGVVRRPLVGIAQHHLSRLRHERSRAGSGQPLGQQPPYPAPTRRGPEDGGVATGCVAYFNVNLFTAVLAVLRQPAQRSWYHPFADCWSIG
jgi:hypothetical protein